MTRAPTLALLASVALLAGCPGDQDANRTPIPRRPPPVLPHAWPPEKGKPFPDLAFLDAAGGTVTLADFRGKVLLIEPVGISCPGCQAYSGGATRGGLGGVTPQPGLPSFDEGLESAGVDPRHPDLMIVQVLFFDLKMGTPTIADASAWARHFGWTERANVTVLVGDERYRAHPATEEMVPGFYLVDRDGTLLLDGAMGEPPEDELFSVIVPRVAALLGVTGPAAAEVEPATLCPPEEHPERVARAPLSPFKAALAARDFEAMEAELDRLRALGRMDGTLYQWTELALPLATDDPELLDAWFAARPRSAWALTARGKFLISWAWEARGGGYANTVSEEGWRLFGERLAGARVELETALRLDPGSAEAAAALITVARGLGLERPVAQAWFEAALKARPGDLAAHREMLTFLMPKWHGDVETMSRFVGAALKEHPDDPALLVLVDEATDELARMVEDSNGYLRDKAKGLDDLHAKIVEAFPRRWQSWKRRSFLASLTGDEVAERAHGLAAAEAGDPWWQWVASDYLLSGRHAPEVPLDVARGLSLLCRSAHNGRAEAQADLGGQLEEGAHGLTVDVAAAVDLYQRAARAGNSWAVAELARCAAAGRGVKRDLDAAIAGYEAAAAASGRRDKARADEWRRRATELRRRGGPRGVRHADGFDDWYPEDASAPFGQSYPCELSPLPRGLEGIPAPERRFANHLAAVALDAARSKLVFFRGLRWDGRPSSYLDRVRNDLTELRERLAAEEPPPGLESVKDDVLAALELQAQFCAEFAGHMLPERARIEGLADGEARRRWSAANGRVFPSIAAGKQASERLRAAWAKLEARYEKTWSAPVKDSLFHHLCAMDLY